MTIIKAHLIKYGKVKRFPCIAVPYILSGEKIYIWNRAEIVDKEIRGDADYFELCSVKPEESSFDKLKDVIKKL